MKEERSVTVTLVNEPINPKMPFYFIAFINEAARVIQKREKNELKNKEAN